MGKHRQEVVGALAGRRPNQDLNGVEAPFFQLVCGVPWVALVVRDGLLMREALETWVPSLGQEDPLEEGTATLVSVERPSVWFVCCFLKIRLGFGVLGKTSYD